MESLSQDVETRIQELNQPRQSNKRKRDSPGVNGRILRHDATPEQEQGRAEGHLEPQHPYYAQQNGNAEYSIQQQVARHVANANASSSTAAAALNMPQLHVPQPTELSFPSTNSGNEEERHIDSSFDMGPESNQQHAEGGPYNLPGYSAATDEQAQNAGGGTPSKPAVGTDEWHKVRKDNHKEVERRRRETINEGINELAKIVPGCDKNKGAILQRGVQYISQLKENESRNIEKWSLEKMLNDQAIAELTSSLDRLKDELSKAKRDAELWRSRCETAGVDTTTEEIAGDPGRGR